MASNTVSNTVNVHQAIVELRRRLMLQGYLDFLMANPQTRPAIEGIRFLPKIEQEIAKEFSEKQPSLSLAAIQTLGRLMRERLA